MAVVISRNILAPITLLIIITVISFSAGFLYKYQPQQEKIKLTVEAQTTTKNQNTFHSGIITKIEIEMIEKILPLRIRKNFALLVRKIHQK